MAVNAVGVLIRAALVVATTCLGARYALAQETPPAAELGTVSGTVVDRSNGDAIIEAGVEVVGHRKTVRTNVDGRYSIKLPPGKYELRFYAPYFKGVRLPDVIVKPGEVARADAALESAGPAGVQVVEVVAPAKKAAEAAQIAKRKEAAEVSDTISRETMAKSTGSEASDVVKRAPAVAVRNDKFVFVRGLSERYTSALLNGNTLPSPDPFRRAVPLDLFPTEFLDAIDIVKTFSPNLPGDFTGGLVELDLRDLPDQLTYNLGISTGANTNTTFQDFLTYPGARLDYFASGKKSRQLPLPETDLNLLPVPEQYSIARTFPNIWSPRTTDALPNFGANLSIGNRFGPFGFQLGGLWSTEWTTQPNEITRELDVGENQAVTVDDNLRGTTGFFQAKLGGVMTAGYEPTERHRFTFRTFVYQNAIDGTTLQTGTINAGTFAQQSQLQYILDSLAYGQLGGEHKFADWLLMDWRTALARTRRDEPDTRLTLYLGGPPPRFASSAEGDGGRRYAAATREDLSDTRVDFTIPFQTGLPFTDFWSGLPAKFKFGPAYSYRSRDFSLRQFDYFPDSTTLDTTLPPEILLAPSNLTPGIIGFRETTDIQDTYTGTQEIIGGYGLFELPIIRDRLRVVGGVRYEYSLIRLDTGVIVDPTSGICPGRGRQAEQCFLRFRKLNTNPLPGINVIASPIDNMNIRLSYGQSVARPEFRELAPSEFPTLFGEPPKRGNPDLVQTEITSYDARWEWFFSPLELVSLGFFYKELTGPIEQVGFIEQNQQFETWQNSGDATLIGFEFEGRKNLAFIHELLRPLSVLTNVTWSDSTVEVMPQRLFGTNIPTQPTDTERRLVGQSPFIINAALDYTDPERFTARLLYYTAAESIDVAGATGLPNEIFQRRDQLDAALIVPLKRWVGLPINARLTVENILNTPFVFTQGPVVISRYTTGVKFTIGLTLTQ
jgi:Carboxypeptidase regulatory-like domain/Outer membrane protein beta-barrel family/TonB-dependent Receptor Plug Domain